MCEMANSSNNRQSIANHRPAKKTHKQKLFIFFFFSISFETNRLVFGLVTPWSHRSQLARDTQL